jgi:hypothetical protein
VLAHQNVRYGGEVQVEVPSDQRLRTITEDLVPEIVAYDRGFFPAPRERFLQCWLRADQHKGLALIAHGEVHGYG